jgi:hypothetical protein
MGLAIADLLECHVCDIVEWQFAPHCSRSPLRLEDDNTTPAVEAVCVRAAEEQSLQTVDKKDERDHGDHRSGSEPADEDPYCTTTGADDPDQPIRPRAFFDDKLISGSLCYAHAVTPE